LKNVWGAGRILFLSYDESMKLRDTVLLALITFLGASCATTDKPVKPMVFASAAMKGAERARAERLAPDLYRKAEVKFWSARKNYMQKNFELAQKDAKLAKLFFEKAEIKASLKSAEGSDDE
jgi:hypothetical protein